MCVRACARVRARVFVHTPRWWTRGKWSEINLSFLHRSYEVEWCMLVDGMFVHLSVRALLLPTHRKSLIGFRLVYLQLNLSILKVKVMQILTEYLVKGDR